jgi:hypothetical protein
LGAEPYATLNDGSWRTLEMDHADTRDLAVHPESRTPYLASSDGGMHRASGDGRSFGWVGGPSRGLDANVVTEVTGQYVPGRAEPDLYFATQHNDLWSMRADGLPYNQDHWEGFGFGLPSHATPGSRNQVTYTACSACGNRIADIHMSHPRGWSDPQRGVGNPLFLAPNRYVQAVTFSAFPPFLPGLQYTTDEGGHWRHIATIPFPMYGYPKVTGRPAIPRLVQPYSAGPRPEDGLDQVRLLVVSGFADGGPGTVRYAAMNNFGSLGVTFTDFATYEVLAVDPNNRARFIAVDVLNNDVRRTVDGGNNWIEIPRLGLMATHGRQYRFSVPQGRRFQPNISTISICPYNSSRVLIGTRQGGALLSLDGGVSWRQLSHTDSLVYTTSIYWLEGCGSAYVSTYARGIYRLDMLLRTETVRAVSRRCEPPLCREVDIIRDYVHKIAGPHQAIRGLLVTDGYIKSIKRVKRGKKKGSRLDKRGRKHRGGRRRKRRITRVVVTPGSILTFFRHRPKRLRIVVAKRKHRAKRPVVGVFFRHGKLLRRLRHKPIVFHRLKRGHVGRGLAHPPERAAAIQVKTPLMMFGNAYGILKPEQRLVAHAAIFKPSNAPLQWRVDGHVVAKVPPGAKEADYAAKSGFGRPGFHTVELVATGPKPTFMASAPVIVGNEDER